VTAVLDAPIPGPAAASEAESGRRLLGGRLSIRTAVTPIVLVVASVVVWKFARSRITDFDRAQVNSVLNRSFMQARIWEHIKLSFVSTALAVAIAVPSGILMTRGKQRRLGTPLLWFANVGQAVPTVSVLALVYTFLASGFRPALIALWVYSILPVLQNTVVGIRGVDPDVVEAAQGMGMSPRSVLLRVELPLALPVIIAGIRTAVVLNVGTAALASFVGAGGLGQVIDTGVTNLNSPLLYAGAGFTAILALAADWLVALIGDLITPVGV
jgi:osmoprotectant transport system permease protein